MEQAWSQGRFAADRRHGSRVSSRVGSRLAATLLIALTGCAGEPNRARAPAAPAGTPTAVASSTPWGPRTEVASAQRPLGTGTLARAVGSRKGGGTYKIGKPYQIRGRWYYPREEPGYDRVGIASWYGAGFHGKRTANGEIYDQHALTAAHPTLPLPSYVQVTSVANGRTLLLRINDRGPYVPGRIIDLSHAAAKALGTDRSGLGRVRVRYAGRAPLDGDDSKERRFLASQPWWRNSASRMGLLSGR